jgi:hypothetical protein
MKTAIERATGSAAMLAEIFMLKLEAAARAAKEPARFVPVTLPPPPGEGVMKRSLKLGGCKC